MAKVEQCGYRPDQASALLFFLSCFEEYHACKTNGLAAHSHSVMGMHGSTGWYKNGRNGAGLNTVTSCPSRCSLSEPNGLAISASPPGEYLALAMASFLWLLFFVHQASSRWVFFCMHIHKTTHLRLPERKINGMQQKEAMEKQEEQLGKQCWTWNI